MKIKTYKGSISKKLRWIIFFVTSITVFTGYSLIMFFYLDNEKADAVRLNTTIQSVIAQDLAKLIFLNNVSAAADITAKLKAFKKLNAVVVYNQKGEAIYEYVKNDAYKKRLNNCQNGKITIRGKNIEISSDIYYYGKKIGCSIIDLHFDNILTLIRNNFWKLVLFYLSMLLLSFILANYYAKRFTKPILRLSNFLESIEFPSSLHKRIRVEYDDEFGKLYEETNIMLDNIERSIEAQKKAEEEVEYLRQYDPLTGFAKKELFLQSLQAQIDSNRDKKNDMWHLMMCLNIKQFNKINDLYGHKTGDIILNQLAKKIQRDFKDATLLGQIGIDEFVICYRDISDKKEEAVKKVERAINILKTKEYSELTIEGERIPLFLYSGINVYQDDHANSEDLLRQTDAALHLAKNKDYAFAFYNEEIEREALKYFQIENDLRKAVEEKQFELYYQLQYKDDGSIYGAEALIRWRHPQRGIIPPQQFINIAEESGLIIPIGNWVIETGCHELAQWAHDERTKDWVLSINVSSKQFDSDVVTTILKAVSAHGVDPSKLKVELTESLFLQNQEENTRKLQKLKSAGIQISLDDFGTGYSSLQYLKKLPLSQIKIDQSFIFGMLEDQKDMAIIESITRLAKVMGLDVIAEGVEMKEHYELLRKMHCHYFQGYYFAKPEPMDKIRNIIFNA